MTNLKKLFGIAAFAAIGIFILIGASTMTPASAAGQHVSVNTSMAATTYENGRRIIGSSNGFTMFGANASAGQHAVAVSGLGVMNTYARGSGLSKTKTVFGISSDASFRNGNLFSRSGSMSSVRAVSGGHMTTNAFAFTGVSAVARRLLP